MEQRIERKTFWQKIAFVATFYTGTLLPEVLPWNKHWHVIADGLILGGLPIKTKFAGMGNHAQKIAQFCQKRGRALGGVLSVVNPFEIRGENLGLTPVSPKDWQDLQVDHTLIPMDDFGGNIDISAVKAGVDKMKQIIDRGKFMYVHCKAGKGRSFSFVTCYLLITTDLDVTQIFALIRSKRPQVSPSTAQYQLIERFRQAYCPHKAPLNVNSKHFQSYRKDWSQYGNYSVVRAVISAIAAVMISGCSLVSAVVVAAIAGSINPLKNGFDEKSYADLKNSDLSKLTLDQLQAVQSGMESAIEWKGWGKHLPDMNATLHYACYRGGMRLRQENDKAVQEIDNVIKAKSRVRA